MADDDTVSDPTANPAGYPALRATSWAVLGILSFGEELSGYDMKKWADWSLSFFYWAPSYSQIYGELHKLEELGLVTSRIVDRWRPGSMRATERNSSSTARAMARS